MIYQHDARGADAAITGGIDAHVQAERGHEDGGRGPGPCGLTAHYGAEDQLWRGR
jgi:hypothetical protein